MELQRRRAQRYAQGQFVGCSTDPAAGRAHGRGRAAKVQSQRYLERICFRPGHGSGNRPDNNRIGVGGSYRLTKRFRIDGEASDGNLGPGGKIGTSFLYSERTSLYLNYSLENERTDNDQLVHSGSWGNLVSGVKTRL